MIVVVSGGLSACGHPSESRSQHNRLSNPTSSEDNNEASKIVSKTKGGTKTSTGKTSEIKVKSFAFAAPTDDWKAGEPGQGDGTCTKAGFTMLGSPTKLVITSIGLPATGPDAAKLVKECETGFAQGMAKHSDMTREWIAKGFSISRYTDPANGEVSVWCISDTCKVRLDFMFGTGSKVADNVKVSDSTVNAFFEKNPAGGAILK